MLLFLIKYQIFLQKIATIRKIKKNLVLKSIFSEAAYAFVHTYQFKVSSLTMTSFKHGR